MATTSISNKPACLHVPALSEGSTADISWSEVDGAVGYELSCSFDGDASGKDSGFTWGDLHDREKPCSATGGALSWQEFADQPARGRSWYGIAAGDRSWSEHESDGSDWGALHALQSNHVVYRGAGAVADGPGQIGEWDNLNAHCLEWEEIHGALPSWQDLTQKGTDGANHLSCAMRIPPRKKTASFRVRACAEDGSTGDYITTGELPIVPHSHRSDTLRFNVVAGDDFFLQIHTRGIEGGPDAALTLDYSPYYLQLRESLPQLSYGMQSGEDRPAPLKRFVQKSGRITFRWPDEAKTASDHSVLLFQVKALRSGCTEVKIN